MRRFRRFYELHQKRRIIGDLDTQKRSMISALWANSNWDDKKGTRKRAIDDIDGNFSRAVEAVEAAFMQRNIPDEGKLSDDNPFFAAADRGLAKVDAKVRQMKGGGGESEGIDYMKDLDQAP